MHYMDLSIVQRVKRSSIEEWACKSSNCEDG